MIDPHPEHPNLLVVEHPLIRHKLTIARSADTGYRAFRAVLNQIAGLMLYEVTRTLPDEPITVRTPLDDAPGSRIAASITVCPVLRAGLGMAEGVLELMPEARVGHIGLVRDEQTLRPIAYMNKLPADLDAGPVIVADPMLATGGSACAALDTVRHAGATDVRMICLVASPEGTRRLAKEHPAVPVYTAALDDRLDDNGYIRPGLGDAGDRLFGTH